MTITNKITKQDHRFGRHIQKLRKAAGLTQEELAEKLGVTTTWVGYIETGLRKPNLKRISRMAKLFGVKVKDMFPF